MTASEGAVSGALAASLACGVSWGFHLAHQQRYGTDPAKILGYVMAHELGHLLLGRGAHSFTGIMRGGWDRHQILSVEMSSLRFTNEQARLIRSTVSEMNADYFNASSVSSGR